MTAAVWAPACAVRKTWRPRHERPARQRARGRPHPHSPWSRHDLGFLASSAAVLAIAVVARVAGWAAFNAYPSLRAPVGARTLGVAAVLLVAALAPFLNRQGIER